MRFKQVVIKNVTQQKHNIHLAVHPFYFDEVIRHFEKQGDYKGGSFQETEVVDWQRRLLDELWAGIPGLHSVFFTNGEITLQHAGIFDDEEIITSASEIIQPYLEQELKLRQLTDES